MEYTSYNQLKGKEVCNFDSIIFNIKGKEYRYYVTHTHLSNVVDFNDEIFKNLEINKWEFCKDIYGYIPTNYSSNNIDIFRNRSFPESQYNDYGALTRVTLALFKICEKINTPKFNKIKII